MLKNFYQNFSTKSIAGLIFLYTIIPFLLLCIYNVPLGDDFWYANAFKENGLLDTQTKFYEMWSGRYMATFLISTANPLSYGYLNLAFIHPLILLSATALSMKLFVKQTVKFFKFPISSALLFSILFFFYLNHLPDVGETFYWMAGAYTYQIPIIFLFIYLASLLKIFEFKSIISIIINSLVAAVSIFVIIGSNEVIAIYLCGVNIIIIAVFFAINKKWALLFFPLVIITLVLAYFMIFAEGNFTRADLFQKQSFHELKSGLHSLTRSVFVLFFWIPTLLLLLLTIPNITQSTIALDKIIPIVLKSKKVLIGFVAILIVATFVGFFPSIYTTNWIPQRAYTPIFAVFMILFIFLFFALNHYFPILNKLNNFFSTSKSSVIIILLMIIALSHNSNVMNAYLDLSSGKASSHYHQAINAYNKLNVASANDTIVVNEIAKRPLVLPMRWPQAHNKLANKQWELYFGVKRVELK